MMIKFQHVQALALAAIFAKVSPQLTHITCSTFWKLKVWWTQHLDLYMNQGYGQ
jgi:hypothetical protein